MRTLKALKLLESKDTPVSKTEMANKLNVSESSVRNLVRSLSKDKEKNGFEIETIRGQGYVLTIRNRRLYNRFLRKNKQFEDVYDPKHRCELIIAFLLQKQTFVTIDEIAETMKVSKNTIFNDLKKVESILLEASLNLERKPYYGIRITGSEIAFRKLFNKYVFDKYPKSMKEFMTFRKEFDLDELSRVFDKALKTEELEIHSVAFENVIRHVRVLVFRALKENFLMNHKTGMEKPDTPYVNVASILVRWIEQKYQITLPESETEFLAAHISGKTTVGEIELDEKERVSSELRQILKTLDEEFLTDFSTDRILHNDLLFHMLPLMKRLYYNMQLDNPLINEIYSEYANVFITAFRFSELIEKKYGFKLSRDEAGYVAIHFAAHFERRKNTMLDQYQRIVLITKVGGGSEELIKLKLESMFQNAYIMSSSPDNLERFKRNTPDIFFSTVPFDNEFEGIPVVHINSFIDEKEARRIKEQLAYLSDNQLPSNIPRVKDLFFESLFHRTNRKDYLEVLEKQALDLEEKGFAEKGFHRSVIEREKKFTTIYNNGIAGPHPMVLNAKQDSVSVTIFSEPVEYQNKKVEIMFLINLKSGHLFLHRELSRMLMKLMKQTNLQTRLKKAQDYKAFKAELELLF